MGNQSETLFHEILDVQKILVGWTKFLFSTEIWAEQLKKHLVSPPLPPLTPVQPDLGTSLRKNLANLV